MCAPFATPYQSASVFLAVFGTHTFTTNPVKPESYVIGTVALNSEFSLSCFQTDNMLRANIQVQSKRLNSYKSNISHLTENAVQYLSII